MGERCLCYRRASGRESCSTPSPAPRDRQRRLVTPDQAARLLGWGESPILAHLLSLTTGLERRAPRGGEG